ncbi:hypothetical protein I5E68_14775 [Novosphingobium sp. YJ-S2-02]|uniref:Uncharacterized protein n=1 Tax=Novosphingobium aureum TaxID=2792964 RepID=A0A931MMJ1_9SPHN|nr:hypothetical protein [Novosphingobium aureum]MBH0114206.1 hypothetical protein [Novosphingobium aureum]
MTARAPFKQAEVTKALKGAVAAGMKPRGVSIDHMGRIVVLFSDNLLNELSLGNPWDEEFTQ